MNEVIETIWGPVPTLYRVPIKDRAVNLNELAKLVRTMRAKQSEYFRQRNNTVLAECRDLERHVDQAVKDILNPKAKDLFGGGE